MKLIKINNKKCYIQSTSGLDKYLKFYGATKISDRYEVTYNLSHWALEVKVPKKQNTTINSSIPGILESKFLLQFPYLQYSFIELMALKLENE